MMPVYADDESGRDSGRGSGPGRRRGRKTLRQKDRILTPPGKQQCTDEVRRPEAAESFR